MKASQAISYKPKSSKNMSTKISDMIKMNTVYEQLRTETESFDVFANSIKKKLLSIFFSKWFLWHFDTDYLHYIFVVSLLLLCWYGVKISSPDSVTEKRGDDEKFCRIKISEKFSYRLKIFFSSQFM